MRKIYQAFENLLHEKYHFFSKEFLQFLLNVFGGDDFVKKKIIFFQVA